MHARWRAIMSSDHSPVLLRQFFPLWKVNREWICLRVFLQARFSAVTSQTSQRLPATSQIVQIYQAHTEVKQQLSLGNSGS